MVTMSPPEQAVGKARAAHRVASALERSAELRLWRYVAEAQRWPTGEISFRVPSTSRDLVHLVVKRRRVSPAEPVASLYSCSCEAHRREACVHRAAVFQHLYRQRFGAVPVRVHATAPAQDLGRAA